MVNGKIKNLLSLLNFFKIALINPAVDFKGEVVFVYVYA